MQLLNQAQPPVYVFPVFFIQVDLIKYLAFELIIRYLEASFVTEPSLRDIWVIISFVYIRGINLQ